MKPSRIRFAVVISLVLLVFGAIFYKMHDMQIANVDKYIEQAQSRTQKKLVLYGMRGTIYDSDMIPIAYSKRSFNVQFYRDPSRSSAEDRAAYTQAIMAVIELVESRGKETISEFWLEKGDDDKWHFNTGTENAAADAKRKEQWRANFSLTGVEEDELFDRLVANYAIPKGLSDDEKVKILAIWQESRMNAFNSEPVTIAFDVQFETVAEIEVRSTELLGVSIAESSTRVYPKGMSAAHTIGYISKITTDENLTAYKQKGYPNDAVVGMTGIEYSMEYELTPYIETRQGRKIVELNNKGKIIRELEYQAPVNGNDVVLTLDMYLQSVAERSLKMVINGIHNAQVKEMRSSSWKAKNRTELRRYATLNQPVKTAQTGAVVAMDPNSGNVWALASYPSFDLSMFGTGVVDPDAWRAVVQDERNPMYNRAVSTRDTPGSIFKMVTALAGLMEGVITPETRITDRGAYGVGRLDTVHPPSCWVSSDGRYEHANLNVTSALSYSCNYFFFTVGENTKIENISKWGAALGLTSKTGIELPNESTSFIGNQLMLYDSDRTVNDQYTSKPIFSAAMIKRRLRQVGEDRGITYDEELLDTVAKKMLDMVTDSGPKSDWNVKIREILLNDMNLPVNYIARHALGNDFYGYLNDLRWTSLETVMASIGQSITQVTPVAVSRYVAAVANGGTVYDLQVIDKIISPTGQVVLDKEPVIVNRIDAAEQISYLQEGMKNVTSVENDGTAARYFSDVKGYKIAAKTGTAQRSRIDIENNSWLVTYAPADDPQIVVVVYVQNGYAGARSANCAIDVIEAYMAQSKLKDSNTIPKSGQMAP